MAFLLRLVSTELKYIKHFQPKLQLFTNANNVSRATIHQSAVCQIEKETYLQILQQEKTSVDLIKVPKREPFLKNLLLTNLDKQLIVYPQVIDKTRYLFLNEMHEAIESYFTKEVNGQLIDEKGEFPEMLLKDLKALGLFGLIIPQEYGGLGFSQTELCRIIEAVSINPSISISLIAHQCLAAKAIMEHGTDEQKNKYLPAMATGEKIGAFCFTEESGGSDPDCLLTKLDVNVTDDRYILNGIKTWVTNGSIANIFIVIAKELVDSHEDTKLTAVIVDDIDNSVLIEKQSTIGMKGANLAKVTFHETYLTSSDLLGERRAGLNIALDVYNVGRISVGAICTGVSKHLIELCTDYVLNREMYNIKMSDLSNVREKIIKMTARTYAIESFTYFVAGLDDLYEDQDYVIESSALKLTATNALLENCEDCMKMMASRGCDSKYPFERHLRDAHSLSNFLGSNDVTSLVIALDSLQFCGNNLSTLVLKKRRFLEHPKYNVTKFFKSFMNQFQKDPKYTMNFFGNIHPILEPEAKELENLITYLSYAIEKSLILFGSKVASEQHQYITIRVGNCTANALMLLSSISRASRSACLAIPEVHIEVKILTYLFKIYSHMSNQYIAEIYNGIDNVDVNVTHDLSHDIVNFKKFAVRPPIFRTIW